MKPVKRGTRLSLKLVNQIIAQANRGGRIDAGRGMGSRSMPGGTILTEDPVSSLLTEPAHEVLVMNEGTTLIAALSPAGIVKSLGKTDGEVYTERVLRVRPPKAEDAGNFVIAQDEIEPGAIGWAWCGGVCIVRLMRWFECDQLERADILVGQQYALASVDGALDILWSQRTDADIPAPIVSAEHLAIVRFNGRRFQLWKNGGTVTAPYGCPIVSKVTDTSGVVDGERFDVLSCRVPVSADSKTLAYVNVGGDVAAGEYGRCTTGDALVRTAASYNAGQSIGAVTSLLTMSSSGTGFVVMARLGTFQSIQYAIAKVAGGTIVQLRTVQIIGGQTLTSGQAGCKYSSAAITSVPSAYDPAVLGTFIDGICRGLLFVNGVSTATNVLVLNDSTTAIQRALVVGDVIAVQDTVAIPVAGDPNGATVSAYPVLFL